MKQLIAFDIYDTLIDTRGVDAELQTLVGDQAEVFSRAWRNKQLEYTFRRGLMQKYENFSVCTRQSLEYTCQSYGYNFTQEQIEQLLKIYAGLPAFADAEPALSGLQNEDYKVVAFSNGLSSAVDRLLLASGIRSYFSDIISADELKTYKPDPKVYQHLLKRCESTVDAAWLVSCNPFDIIGAKAVGIKTAWLQRTERNIFDPWEISPDITIDSLSQLQSHL